MIHVKRMALIADRYSKSLNKPLLSVATVIVLYLLLAQTYYVITVNYFVDFFPRARDFINLTSEYALLFTIFLPLGYAQQLGAHIKVDALICRLSPRVNAWLGIVVSVISLFAFTIFTWSAAKYTAIHYHDLTDVIFDWPLFPILLVIPIGFGLLALQLVVTLLKQIAALSPSQPDNIAKTGDTGSVELADLVKS